MVSSAHTFSFKLNTLFSAVIYIAVFSSSEFFSFRFSMPPRLAFSFYGPVSPSSTTFMWETKDPQFFILLGTYFAVSGNRNSFPFALRIAREKMENLGTKSKYSLPFSKTLMSNYHSSANTVSLILSSFTSCRLWHGLINTCQYNLSSCSSQL